MTDGSLWSSCWDNGLAPVSWKDIIWIKDGKFIDPFMRDWASINVDPVYLPSNPERDSVHETHIVLNKSAIKLNYGYDLSRVGGVYAVENVLQWMWLS